MNKKKILTRLLIMLGGLIFIMLIILPVIIRRTVTKNSKEWIGRQISLDKLKFNYFTTTARLINFKMFEADGQEVFVSFDTLQVDLEPWPLLQKELVVEQLYLKGLKTTIIRKDSTFNFDDLIEFYASTEDTLEIDTVSTKPARFRLSNLELKQGELIFVDKPLNKTTEMHELDFFIPYIGWNQEENSEAGLKFFFRNGGFLQSAIQVDPVEGDYEAQVNIDRLDISNYLEYAAQYANLGSLKGLVNTRFKLQGNVSRAEQSVLSGKVELVDFELTDDKQQKFLAWQNMDCLIGELDAFDQQFVIDSLKFMQPYILFELFDSTNNFFRILNYEMAEEQDSMGVQKPEIEARDTLESTPLYYTINSLVIDQGIVDYVDHLTSENFDYHLSEIQLDVDSIDSRSEWVNLYSKMLLNNRGKLTAEVGFNPSNPMDIDLNYVITDFQLSDLNIYSRHYMGFPILYGDMYYKSATKILGGQLTSENQLVIENVELGNKTGGLYDLPLKFALFLLEDRNGVINLDIPVRGDLKDPRVSIGKIIWNTFKNLIIKVAAAPFDLLSGLLSVDPKDIKAIEFEYLDTLFTPMRQRQLDLLLELEQKKKGLDIELVYFNDVENEFEQIALYQAGELFNRETGQDYLKEKEAFVEFVLNKIAPDSMALERACIKLSEASVLDSISDSFRNRRISALENYLRTTNDSTIIHISIPDPDAPKNVGSKPLFEVKYSMKDAEMAGD
jgi:hypothetical protein